MEYRQLGRSGVRVSPLCLGTYNFGGPTSRATSIRIIHQAFDAGINFVNCGNEYQDGRSEEIIGEAVKGRRDDVIIGTSVYLPIGSGPNDRGTSRFAIMREVDRSLRRLKTDWIDLYQLHRYDPETPLEEAFGALNDLVRAGKVRYIGISAFPAWVAARAVSICERDGLAPIVSEQPPYNLVERDVERELLPACRALGIGVLPFSPLCMGLLTDRFTKGRRPAKARFTRWFSPEGELWEPAWTAVDQLADLAVELGTTLPRLALAWVRDVEGVSAPVIGPRTAPQLTEALRSLDLTLDEHARDAVDRIVPPGTSLWFRVADEVARRKALE